MRIILAILLLFPSILLAATLTLSPTSNTMIDPDQPDTNFSTEAEFSCMSEDDSATLFTFDLSGIAAGDVISAEFSIYSESRGSQHDIVLRRNLQNVVCGEATWNIYSTGNSWGAAGSTDGTVDYTVSNEQTVAIADNDWNTLDATELVKDMITNGTSTLLLRAVNQDLFTTFRSVNYAEAEFRPKLTIRTGTAGIPTTWYIRTDGGTCGLGNQCEGTTDAPYPGTGTDQACACNSPSEINNLMVGEDIVIIKSGKYVLTEEFSPAGGSSSTLTTKIYGEGWDTGVGDPPILSGDNVNAVIDLKNQSFIDIEYIDITDEVPCINVLDNTNATYGCTDTQNEHNATAGIYAIEANEGITLKDVNIHGVSTRCLFLSRVGNWTFDNFTCRGVGMVGIDGDYLGGEYDDTFFGTFHMTDSTIEFVGCAEDLDGNIIEHSCVGQGADINVGYGDAFGFADDISTWIVDNLTCQYNMSDCFDGLYAGTNVGAYLIFRNSRFISNTGAAVKGATTLTLENNLIIDDCAWPLEKGMLDSKFLSGGEHEGNQLMCRADTGVSLGGSLGGQHRFIGNTFYSNHDSAIVYSGCADGSTLFMRNNIFRGAREYNDDTSTPPPFDHPAGGNGQTDAIYPYNGCSNASIDEDYNIFYNTKEPESDLQGAHSRIVDPEFIVPIPDGPADEDGYFDEMYTEESHFYLSETSTSRYEVYGDDTADETVTLTDGSTADLNYFERGEHWDTGALEFGSMPTEPPQPPSEGSPIGGNGDLRFGGNSSARVK